MLEHGRGTWLTCSGQRQQLMVYRFGSVPLGVKELGGERFTVRGWTVVIVPCLNCAVWRVFDCSGHPHYGIPRDSQAICVRPWHERVPRPQTGWLRGCGHQHWSELGVKLSRWYHKSPTNCRLIDGRWNAT